MHSIEFAAYVKMLQILPVPTLITTPLGGKPFPDIVSRAPCFDPVVGLIEVIYNKLDMTIVFFAYPSSAWVTCKR